jgi:hypothetical protein
VDDAEGVGVIEGVGYPGDQVGGLTERELPGLQVVAQGDALDELGDEGGPSAQTASAWPAPVWIRR